MDKRQFERFVSLWDEFSTVLSSIADQLSMSDKLIDNISNIPKSELELFRQSRLELRKLVFEVDEDQLVPCDVYSWNEFKINHEYISNIGFITPFSYLLSLQSPAEIYHASTAKPAGKGTNPLSQALYSSHEFLEYLHYKFS